MHVDVLVNAAPLRQIQRLATSAEAEGFAGLVVTESGRTAYLSCAAAALAAPGLDLATGVAVAFPRSPMVTASTAWELAEVTGGRFRLGLGTQVRAHIERRYAADFDPPGPRLREYVLALRAIFRAFRGEEKLAFDGDVWKLSLLPREWSPGPIDAADPPIDVAAVNPWMLRMAGEVADGVHVHPLNTPTYVRETVLPSLAEGAARAGRDPGALTRIVPCFTVAGDTEEERAPWREWARMQVAFYGSTPNYAFVFEQVGAEGTTPRLREKQKAGDLAGMAAVIDDDLLAHFVVEADWDDLADGIAARYQGLADRVVLYFAGTAWQRDPSSLARFGEVARAVHAATG
ncbi:MAG: TIGR03617 family F420-dependent LLM class oxidoreductase [Acidimicrobiales bacterium]